MSNILSLLLIVVFGLTAEHYFPHWHEWTGRKLPDPVRLVLNYIAGSVAWFGPFSLWLVVSGLGKIAVVGWLFAFVAASTVIFLYTYDSYVANRRAKRDLQEVNDLLERRANAKGERS